MSKQYDAGIFTLPDFKLYYRVILTKTTCTDTKTDAQTSGKEQNIQK
jgi:hypothetical protein